MAKTYEIADFFRNGQEAYIEFSHSPTRPNIAQFGTLTELQAWVDQLDIESEDYARMLIKILLYRGVVFTNANRANIVGKRIIIDPDNANGNIVRVV